MPPRKAIGARKKTARTPRVATRKTATPKSTAETQTHDAETAVETLPAEIAPQSSGNEEPTSLDAISVAKVPSLVSPLPENNSLAASEAQSAPPVPVLENNSSVGEISKKPTKRIVRKVIRKVPVRVIKKEDKEAEGMKTALDASLEGNENLDANEAVKQEKLNPQSQSQGLEPAVNNVSDEILPAAEPAKKVRKVKKVVLVKKLVRKPKIAQENVKVEETAVNNGTTEDGKIEDGKIEAENQELKGKKITGSSGGDAGDEMIGLSESQKRRKTEIFVGGLDKYAKEDDLKKVFGTVGEILEIRMMMDGKTGKNKGYAFLRYATSAQAKQAVAKFSKVEVFYVISALIC